MTQVENDGRSQITRREAISQTAILGTAALAATTLPPAKSIAADGSREKTRYALVGVGSRSSMYRDAIHKTYAEHCLLVGYCDNNAGRLELAQRKDKALSGVEVPTFDAESFDRMIQETKPEVVIVTPKDGVHHQYIIRAMELGCDVITEKPMTIDEEKCQAILDTQKRTGKRCTVTFNYRYSPHATQVKDLLMSGVIGDVLSLDFHWLLNTSHGADYFRRWHSHKSNSGGLMVHKSTHHFDLVNWWLSAVPVSVQSNGKREFYTPEMAKRLGLESYHERCHTCPEKKKCTFELDMSIRAPLKELYLDQEKHDGYFRDQCVFRPDIDIEDTMNVSVKYDTGVTLSYSLNAFNAWEGYTVAFNGTKGRIEHGVQEQVTVFGDGSIPGAIKPGGVTIKVFPIREPAYQVENWSGGEGAHGGGDKVMLDDIFLPNSPADKYLRAADQRAGTYSIITGIAANHGFKTGNTVNIEDLVANVGRPDYPTMPNHIDPVPMPPEM